MLSLPSCTLQIACVAIDCVKEKNKDLCQQEAVKGYPTFHYYNYGKFVEKYDTNPTVSRGEALPRALSAEGQGNSH